MSACSLQGERQTVTDIKQRHRDVAALQAGRRSSTAGMKIEFAPMNVPLRRRFQTAAVLQWMFSFLALAQCCLAVFVLLALSDWWMLALLYSGWLWLDWDTPSSGGRRSRWVRSWVVWDYFRDYFPLTLIKTVDLDPRKNYIFGFHPHGEKLSHGLSVSQVFWWLC
ncbi:unnamed protein product [Pleuronectes platessa]|uniref:Uncharacterized protein n=1 Tax=Pleuronectes platessa TaxID=8262 RepID=A0A9N7V0W0_PLEPL|nr:unnamed protein product [Pleuronectes platessa]